VTADELLVSLEEAGVSLTLDGEDLVARLTAAVTPEMVDLLREHKAEVIAALETKATSRSSATISSEEVFEIAREQFGHRDGDRRDHRDDHSGDRDHHYEHREVDRRGLIAKWSREFGYILVLDPTTGSWHDLHWKDAPGWARWEARKRKELWQAGNRCAFDLTATQMQEIWDAEHPPEPELGIVEDHPLPE
jgi:hypothetical protein